MPTVDLNEITKRAEDGDRYAQFSLANAYRRGIGGLEPDIRWALYWYDQAARQGHVDAQVDLGILYIHELPQWGEDKDPDRAVAWFDVAAEAGDAEAMFYLGRLFVAGEDVPQDTERGLAYYQRACEAGSLDAVNQLATILAEGELVERDLEGSVELLRHGVKAGDVRAHFNLAMHLIERGGRTADLDEAIALLEFAAERGHAEARYNLGALLVRHRAEPSEALHWLRRAAEQGHVEALYEVGQSHRLARGTEIDLAAAGRYYEAAASRGHADAMFNLALMQEQGLGETQPAPEVAGSWYQRAAMSGHAGAAHNLGILYAKGQGVDPDMETALELFEYAVSLGNDEAMFSAGLSNVQLERPLRAAMWAKLSVRHGPGGKGQRLLEALEKDLGRDQLEEAERMAASWNREPRVLNLPVERKAAEVASG